MKTEYDYIEFQIVERKPKTNVWGCFNSKSGDQLARIGWYGPWRQYCVLAFNPYATFHDGCLDDISNFLGQLNKAHKAKKK